MVEFRDVRHAEPRFVRLGRIEGRLFVTVWTPRGTPAAPVVRIISARKANTREEARYGSTLP